MAYSVYKARFKTERGTYRTHVGHTRNLNLRKHRHRKKPPAWLKPKAGEPTFSVLEEGLQTKEDALASEALHSARVLVASPELARGGPWVKPTLPDGALEEAKTAARVRSFRELFSLAQGNKKGLLWKHLKDLEFVPAAQRPSGRTATRGGCVVRKKKSGRSGCTGSQSRKKQLAECKLQLGTAYLERLRRGIQPKERRAAEQKKRKPRKGQPSDKNRKA